MRWLVSLAAIALAVGAWWLPGDKRIGVVGRLDYPQFALALVASALALASVVVALGPAATLRRRLARCAAVCAGVALALLACELAARWFANSSPSRNPFYSLEDPGNLAAPDLPFVRPPHLDWTGPSTGDLSDGLRDAFTQTVRFRTDFEGFRNDTDATRAELAFLGDSNTEAGNVDVDQTFVARAAH